MKHDLFAWQEVKINAPHEVPKGHLFLRLSAATPVYIQAEGVESLLGVQTDFSVEISEAAQITVAAKSGVRAFVRVAPATSYEHHGEVFTNIDRLPQESGMLAEVTRARRQLELERRQMMAEIRAEAAKVRAALAPAKVAKAADAVPAPVEDGQVIEEPAPAVSEGAAI